MLIPVGELGATRLAPCCCAPMSDVVLRLTPPMPNSELFEGWPVLIAAELAGMCMEYDGATGGTMLGVVESECVSNPAVR